MEESASMEIQLATASINNEEQNTQKEANIPGGNEKRNDALVIEIREIVERPEIQIQSSTGYRIYKVTRLLRNWNEKAYTPQEVSIGPFHHKDERLKAMEGNKERYFRSFMKRSEINLEDLVCTRRKMEDSIRGCYEGYINLTSDRFVKMILMDASFILELFFRFSSRSWTSDDPMFVKPRASAVRLDLLLIENQLPFFVIEKLHHLAFPSLSDYSLLELSFDYFRYFNIHSIEAHPNVKIKHFTDLLRTFQIPPPDKLPVRANQVNELLYTATQLHDAGVKFEVRISKSFFDMKFERGVLKIPRLEFDDWTEVVIRNIMALEQAHYMQMAYFTGYFLFMDSLIETRKDVDLLCEKRILVNYLGDNDAAKSMINNLNRGILLISMRDDYVHLCEKLNRFCENRWHRQIAVLKREYFGTPSQATSTIVTIVVITALTLIQTVCSIMQVTGSS